MNEVNNYKNRFFSLLESDMGNVKPLVMENEEMVADTEINVDDVDTSDEDMKTTERKSAMDFIDDFLNQRGGTLGARKPDEIMSDLTELERAINTEKKNLEVYNQRPNPNL
jgi:hypothetical protein